MKCLILNMVIDLSQKFSSHFYQDVRENICLGAKVF